MSTGQGPLAYGGFGVDVVCSRRKPDRVPAEVRQCTGAGIL